MENLVPTQNLGQHTNYWKLECFNSICCAIIKVIVTENVCKFFFHLESRHNLRGDMSHLLPVLCLLEAIQMIQKM